MFRIQAERQANFFALFFANFFVVVVGANLGCQRNISLKLYIERQINVTSDFQSLLVFSNKLVPSKNVKNTRSLRSLDVLLHFFGRYSLRLENTLKL